MDHIEIIDRLTTAIEHIVNREIEQAAEEMAEIGKNSTISQMYGVCRALGEMGRQFLALIYGPQPPDGWFGIVPLPGCDLLNDPARAFSIRFVVAASNSDFDTCQALYHAAVQAGDEEYSRSVDMLLFGIGDLARAVMDIKAATTGESE